MAILQETLMYRWRMKIATRVVIISVTCRVNCHKGGDDINYLGVKILVIVHYYLNSTIKTRIHFSMDDVYSQL